MKEFDVSKEVQVDVDLQDGKVVLEAKYDGKQADASVKVAIDAGLLLDKLKDKIPGKIDDGVIELLKAALKAA